MQDTPVQVIVAAFNTPEGAGQVMADLKQGKKAGLIGIVDAAVVVKDENGKLKVTDSKNRRGKGFVTGGIVGGLIGLLAAPPVAALAVGGGVIGTLVGRLRGAPLRAEMKDIGEALVPNSSALVAVIEHTWIAQLEAALAEAGAQLIQDSIKADIAAQLNAGGNVLYTLAEGESASGVMRVADTEDSIQISSMVATDEGIFIDDAEIIMIEAEAESETLDSEAPEASEATETTKA